jgi:hypothetical protein
VELVEWEFNLQFLVLQLFMRVAVVVQVAVLLVLVGLVVPEVEERELDRVIQLRFRLTKQGQQILVVAVAELAEHQLQVHPHLEVVQAW